MFRHPLSKEELLAFHASKTQLTLIEQELEKMLADKFLFEKNGFYTLEAQPDWVDRRIDANNRADKMLKGALRTGRRIGRLPFVQSVSLSGTIAKGVMYKDSDIDYFVITKANRTWLAKLSLKLYKLIFHLNSGNGLCYNYLLSEEQLTINSQNIYTATEIVTLIPVQIDSVFVEFNKANFWVLDYFPNTNQLCKKLEENEPIEIKQSSKMSLTAWFERSFEGKIGDKWDRQIMQEIQRGYEKKYDKELMETGMKSTKNISKTHPHDMQKKVLNRYEKLLNKHLEQINFKSQSVERDV